MWAASEAIARLNPGPRTGVFQASLSCGDHQVSFRILCTGDVHLGRRPTRIPEGLDAGAFGPAQAWRNFVSSAIDLEVDAVALTGDIVDESNRFYEAFSVLQSGVRQLIGAGIPVVAVAGNHDFEVLPRLADQLPEFRLLGRRGRWEEFVLEREGNALRFCGWSFPTQYVATSPLEGFTPPTDNVPTVGLLHCDCDVPASRYGPVSLSELRAKAPAAWLLGHIHKPGSLSEAPSLVFYPGSPQGLDPGERGSHGATLVTLEPGVKATARQLPLARLRWEAINLEVGDVQDAEALDSAVVQALRATHDSIEADDGPVKTVGCRLFLRGRTALHRRLPVLIETMQGELKPTFDDIDYFIEKAVDLTQPDLPLEEVARSSDPAGLLARKLVILGDREPREEYHRLIRGASRAMEGVRSSVSFAALPDATGVQPEDEIRSILMRTGLSMLDSLLAQKGGEK